MVTTQAQRAAGATYPPPPAFRQKANVQDAAIYDEAERDPQAFWAEEAGRLVWDRPWDEVLAWNPPDARWFVGGQINASVNCLDRHLPERADHEALRWIGEDAARRRLTYGELRDEVARFAGALRGLGVEKGDRVTLYLPMVPELVVATLACARIGAVHNVVFAGFSPNSLAHRIGDSGSRVLVTCDAYYRRGDRIAQKERADRAVGMTEAAVEHVVVVRRFEDAGQSVPWDGDRDVWYHDVVADAEPADPVPVASEDLLFMMYTSGTTGSPKGIMHSTGGYLVGAHATTRWVLDLKPEDVYWCMADIGWITGHSYIVYGPLMVGATVVLYEGAPDWPDRDRAWAIVEEEKATILYTAPTAIRAFLSWGDEHVRKHDLSSLRLLGSVGEPINPRAWKWYHDVVGQGRCPIVDTWWQTETGMMMIAPLPGISDLKPGSALRPVPGAAAAVFDDEGEPATPGKNGNLVLTRPWPAMMKGLWKDPERYRRQYWERWGGAIYATGDGAHVDDDGDYWIAGRLDDVMNVAGHRLSTAEIESALVAVPDVAEAAVVAAPDEVKGHVPIAFVILTKDADTKKVDDAKLKEAVVQDIGAIARPKRVVVVPDLPKTRSGKIMRRILKDIVAGEEEGDVSTLRNPEAAQAVRKVYEKE